MAFSEETKNQAYRRAGGKCECTRASHGHHGRCNATLGTKGEAHHITSQSAGGPDSLSNCEMLCHDCHVNTRSYGGY